MKAYGIKVKFGCRCCIPSKSRTKAIKVQARRTGKREVNEQLK
jgi:hypothetical protein